jgi:excisionase family DNA binding protein
MEVKDKTWLTTKEAAEYLGMSCYALRMWRADGRGPRYSKLSDGRRGAVRYSKAAVDEWMVSREREKGA